MQDDGDLDTASLAMLAVTSMCQEIAFGGVGEDGFLSAGVVTSELQDILNVRLAERR